MNILHIDSSIQGEQSVSRQLSAAIVARLKELSPSASVVYRDLAREPIPQFSPAIAQGQQSDVLASVLDEVLQADTIVVGAPMYNFSVPSQLKSWLDALVVPGRTFRYENGGVEGLLGGKRVIIASSRGGFYGPETPYAAADHQEPLLHSLLGFLGITDIDVVRAEGVRMGDEQATSAIASALERVAAIERPLAA
ncbi:FMN-dependent NADH-azoreductase [Pseudoxanthomonas putridarboris]|uniref:FMN dependent NADH:quinone oxidoreductase n=1 Tax=Pseudoxanthomonas putridarboris TaxID=752605 RepID=A0ABU9IZV1_9GAMM